MRFFLPSSAGGDAGAERDYSELRRQAEACTGSASRDRRISEIECRQHGHDCILRVGDLDSVDGRLVEAILQLGRDTYTVHHAPDGFDEPGAPTVLARSAVYRVADFD